MVVTEQAVRLRFHRTLGLVVGGDGGTACGLEKPNWGKSACGQITREFQQNDKHSA